MFISDKYWLGDLLSCLPHCLLLYRWGCNSPLLGKRRTELYILDIFYIPDVSCTFLNFLLSFNEVIRGAFRVKDLCVFGFTKSHSVSRFVCLFLFSFFTVFNTVYFPDLCRALNSNVFRMVVTKLWPTIVCVCFRLVFYISLNLMALIFLYFKKFSYCESTMWV